MYNWFESVLSCFLPSFLLYFTTTRKNSEHSPPANHVYLKEEMRRFFFQSLRAIPIYSPSSFSHRCCILSFCHSNSKVSMQPFVISHIRGRFLISLFLYIPRESLIGRMFTGGGYREIIKSPDRPKFFSHFVFNIIHQKVGEPQTTLPPIVFLSSATCFLVAFSDNVSPVYFFPQPLFTKLNFCYASDLRGRPKLSPFVVVWEGGWAMPEPRRPCFRPTRRASSSRRLSTWSALRSGPPTSSSSTSPAGPSRRASK